ncbi:MAG: hypothetical protein K2M88_08405 [Muribaculaceae bacterium]|nr:hypothetical protein [Muribaculaceae bacterium]
MDENNNVKHVAGYILAFVLFIGFFFMMFAGLRGATFFESILAGIIMMVVCFIEILIAIKAMTVIVPGLWTWYPKFNHDTKWGRIKWAILFKSSVGMIVVLPLIGSLIGYVLDGWTGVVILGIGFPILVYGISIPAILSTSRGGRKLLKDSWNEDAKRREIKEIERRQRWNTKWNESPGSIMDLFKDDDPRRY